MNLQPVIFLKSLGPVRWAGAATGILNLLFTLLPWAYPGTFAEKISPGLYFMWGWQVFVASVLLVLLCLHPALLKIFAADNIFACRIISVLMVLYVCVFGISRSFDVYYGFFLACVASLLSVLWSFKMLKNN
jgi:hypothetical protein